MYYILFAFLYLFSLLPFFVLYRISDAVYLLLYDVIGYRKKVVMQNLSIAFPQKNIKERKAIARQFYKNLVDTFLESIKSLSMSNEALLKHTQSDFSAIDALIKKGKNIQLHSGHQMNWEFANFAFSLRLSIPVLGVYKRIKSKPVEKLFLKLRKRGSLQLIPLQEFRSRSQHLFNAQYALGLIADQNARDAYKAYWLNFFDKPVPFVTGPDKGARLHNPAIVFVKMVKLKRGYYRYDATVYAENGAECNEGEITRSYRDFLEDTIRQDPANYLWTHRRWRRGFKASYQKHWIDTTPAPQAEVPE